MLGNPEPVIAKTVSNLRRLDGLAQRFGVRHAFVDRGKVEHGEWNIGERSHQWLNAHGWPVIPSTKYRKFE